MAGEASAAGCAVGLTTNADLLAEALDWIASGVVDVLAVSLAGGDEWNRRLRDGVAPDAVFGLVERLARARRRRRKPRIHVAYLLTRGNSGDLVETVRVAAEAGVDSILVNHLDNVPSEELRELTAYSARGVPQQVQEDVERAKRTADVLGIDVRLPATHAHEMLTCALDPRHMASVRWDGLVAPCVHLNLPVPGPIPRATETGVVEVPPYSYGHLDDAPLPEILNGVARQEFVAPLTRRCEADESFRERGLPASSWGAVALSDLDRAYDGLERELEQNPFPAACSGCPKVEGW
jgi:MoaA/NifB/PqqE/SkfB family radical SAM enzyme